MAWPYWSADLRVVAGERVRAAGRAQQVRGGDDQGQRPPPGGVRAGQLAGRLERAGHLGADPGQVAPGPDRPGPAGQQPVPVQDQGPVDSPGVRRHAVHRDAGPGPPSAAPAAQVAGEHGPEEGDVDQVAAELLGDDGDLHAGGPVGAHGAPAGRGHRLLQPRDPAVVGQVVHRAGPEVGGQAGGRVAEARPAQPSAGRPYRSLRTRRSTLPDGSRGISSTSTTRLGRL